MKEVKRPSDAPKGSNFALLTNVGLLMFDNRPDKLEKYKVIKGDEVVKLID